MQSLLRGFQDQDYEIIHDHLSFFDQESPVNILISGSSLEEKWDMIIAKECAQKSSSIQNTFDCTYEVDDLLTTFCKAFIDTAKLYYRENYKNAFESYIECFKDFARLYKVLSRQYTDDWLYKIFNVFCFNLRALALETNENERRKGENKEYLEQALGPITSSKQEMNRLKTEETLDHKIKLLCLLEVHLDWINFKLRNYKAVKEGLRSLIELIRSNNFNLSFLSTSTHIQLCFNWGKIALLTGRIPIAVEKLEEALSLCPKEYDKNIKLILRYLSVAKLLNGQKIKQKIMEKYNLATYYQLEQKIAKGDLRGYYWEMHFRLLRWMKSGLVLLFDNFRFTIYRNILRKWQKVTGLNKISFNEVKKIFELNKNATWYPEYSEDEVQAILSNMIVNGYIRGSISINEQFCMLSLKNPFPKLREVNIEIQNVIQKNLNEFL